MSAPTKQFSSLKPLLVGLVASIVLIVGFGGWAVMAQLSGAIIASGQIDSGGMKRSSMYLAAA